MIFAQAYVRYVSHVAGQGQARPGDVQVKCILEYLLPTTKKERMRFLGYYRKFCQNVVDTLCSLANLFW